MKSIKKKIKNNIGLIACILFFSFCTICTLRKPHTVFASPISGQKVESFNIQVSTWDEIAKMIVDEFKDLGKKTTMEALQIAWCESKFEEKAYNGNNSDGSNDKGCFQINSIHKLPDYVRLDGRHNIKWAKEKYLRDGKSWRAWSCSRILGI